jgi:hypothetical protein
MPAPLSVSSPAPHETAPAASATIPTRAKRRGLPELGNSQCPRMTLVGWNPVTRTGGPKKIARLRTLGKRWSEPAREVDGGVGCGANSPQRASELRDELPRQRGNEGLQAVIPRRIPVGNGGSTTGPCSRRRWPSHPAGWSSSGTFSCRRSRSRSRTIRTLPHEGVGTVTCVARRHDQPALTDGFRVCGLSCSETVVCHEDADCPTGQRCQANGECS